MTTLIGLIIMFAIFSVVFNSKGFAFLAKGAAVLFIGVNTVLKLPKINGNNYPLASFDSFSYRLTS